MILRTRVARSASIKVNAIKSAAYTAALWVVFLFFLPIGIRALQVRTGQTWMEFEPGSGRAIALILFTAASLIGFYSGAILVRLGDGTPMPLECTRNLVIEGPYRYIRNPMSTMGIIQGVCVGLFLGSLGVIAYALVGALVWNYILRPWEEQDLRERFGAQFDDYRRNVPCWRARLSPYSSPAARI